MRQCLAFSFVATRSGPGFPAGDGEIRPNFASPFVSGLSKRAMVKLAAPNGMYAQSGAFWKTALTGLIAIVVRSQT